MDSRPEEKHTKNYMNTHTATSNCATNLALEAQRLIQSHVDITKLFKISKIWDERQILGRK